MALKVVKENPNFVEDTDKGIILPSRMSFNQYIPHAFDDLNKTRGTGVQFGVKHIPGIGTVLEHDSETGIAWWPAYASGLDDFLMRALVTGYMGNSGQTPVVDTLLSTIVAKIQGMVGTWVNTVRGKESPVKKTLDIMARANDSQFGVAEFVREYMGALNVDNRGAIGAQVPIGVIEVDKWNEYGMELEEVQGQRKSGSTNAKPELFVLRMTQEAFRENQGIYMVDGLTCLPTGNKEYPYWIRKYSRSEGRDMWVLIHRDFGFQILQQSGPRNNVIAGFGQSGAWRYSPYEVKHMAIEQMDWEHLIHQPMRGIVWVSGLDTPTQFREQIVRYKEDLADAELKFYPGVFFGGSKGENSKITMMPWVEPPAGYTPMEWDSLKVSKLAASFHLNETHLQLKLGEGAMTQSGVAQSLEAETAVAWMRHTIEMVWNYVSPPRVLVQVIWPSDRAMRFQVETARELSLAISRVNKNPEDPVFANEQIRALFTEYIGIEIPEIGEEDTITTDNHGPEDIGEAFAALEHGLSFSPALSLVEDYKLDREIVYAVGNRVMLKNGQPGIISGWRGNADWVWIKTGRVTEMLVPADRFELVEYAKGLMEIGLIGDGDPEVPETIMHEVTFVNVADPLIETHVYAAGQRVWIGGDDAPTPATVIKASDKAVFVTFDWAKKASPHRYPVSEVRPMAFETEGEPLPFPTEVDTDQGEATTDSKELWGEVAPEGKEDLV